ncbi:MAG: hypothetical protein ACI8TP_000588 [Acidimicrobiales bacterium]|jgi:hypothetical protein
MSHTGTALAPSLRSEFLNLRSTPTAKILLIASMAMAAASLIANLGTIATVDLADDSSLELAMHASTVATLVFALTAGIVGSTSDYRFGRIDQLLLSRPRRSAVLVAKALAGGVVGIGYGLFGAVVAIGATASYYTAKDVPLDLTSAVIVRPLLGALLGCACFVALGVGVGTAVRNQPMALGGSLALLLIAQPMLLLGVPRIGKWLPGSAGLAVTESPDAERPTGRLGPI